MIKFDLQKYNELITQITNEQFINICSNLYINSENTFENYIKEVEQIINNNNSIDITEQIQLKKELYTKNKNIKDDELRKRNFKDLRNIQKKLDNKIDCLITLNVIQQNINKEVVNAK